MATAQETTGRKNRKSNNGSPDTDQEWQDLPEPVIVRGWFQNEEGATIEGVVMERGESESNFGNGPRGFYAIKISKACKAKAGRDGVKTFPVGSIVGVNESAKLRQLQKHMKKGPIAVYIKVLEEKSDGFGWDMDVKVRPAF